MDCSRWTFNRLRKFARLGIEDRALLLRALLIVAAVRAALWILPFRSIREYAHRASERANARQNAHGPPTALLARAIETAALLIPAATCLTQALAAQILLGRAGQGSALRIGVLTAGGRFKAHAWLEQSGHIVIGQVRGIDEFKPLPLR
jgi:hypothetical protein